MLDVHHGSVDWTRVRGRLYSRRANLWFLVEMTSAHVAS